MSSLSFTKLFSSITDSSVWQESDQTRLVWITMLSMADPVGRIHAAIPGLAHRARVPLKATEEALALFMAPDAYSRSKDNDGRRIEEIPGGWRLLNYQVYRELRDEEIRKEQNRIAQERRRKNKTPSSSVIQIDDSQHVSAEMMTVITTADNQPRSAQVEVEVEEEVIKQEHVISPDMIARGVLSELGLGGRELVNVLEEICRSQVKHYDSPGALRDALIEAWRQYDASRPSMTNYVKRPVNFFGDGDWRNKAGWPWKDGNRPSTAKPMTLIEKMRLQEGL